MLEWSALSLTGWIVLLCCGLLIGLAKAGLSGTGLFIVPVMAFVFGGKVSTGIVLPMLIIADIFAVRHYDRHADWLHIMRLLPWAVTGITAGLLVGQSVSDEAFKTIMAAVIIAGIAVMIWQDVRKNLTVPDHWGVAASLGLAGGFATMMGNAAGPIMSLYLLAMRFPKLNFIGTAAWFFFLVNMFKVPLHVLFWKTITWRSLALNLAAAPFIVGGVFLGIKIITLIPEKGYRILVILTTAASALLLLF